MRARATSNGRDETRAASSTHDDARAAASSAQSDAQAASQVTNAAHARATSDPRSATSVAAPRDWTALAASIRQWGRDLGFEAVGVSDVDLAVEELRLLNWLDAGRHGEMHYMARHGTTRARPAELVPGTLRVITARLNYWPADASPARDVLDDPHRGYVARYALGRDYHKVLRSRLAQLAERIANEVGPFGHRVFTDSAPVLEVALAAKSGLGWRGKHTLLLTRDAGSYFFLGELYTDLPLPVTPPVSAHCGTCTACIAACPTGAIVAPYELDARRCISYLTIELAGSIPEELRPLIGNRIYGCDDCQLACPWNRYAVATTERDFASVRNGLDGAELTALFAWTEDEFRRRTEGSAIRRIGYERWLRNVAVALGNAAPDPAIAEALANRAADPSPLVREHVQWAIRRQMPVDR
jgi:epoxyqueuosine reductase